MQLPTRFLSGDTLKTDIGPKLNQVIDYLKSLTPHGDGKTIRANRLPGGTTYSAIGDHGVAGQGESPYIMTVTEATIDGDDYYKISLPAMTIGTYSYIDPLYIPQDEGDGDYRVGIYWYDSTTSNSYKLVSNASGARDLAGASRFNDGIAFNLWIDNILNLWLGTLTLSGTSRSMFEYINKELLWSWLWAGKMVLRQYLFDWSQEVAGGATVTSRQGIYTTSGDGITPIIKSIADDETFNKFLILTRGTPNTLTFESTRDYATIAQISVNNGFLTTVAPMPLSTIYDASLNATTNIKDGDGNNQSVHRGVLQL